MQMVKIFSTKKKRKYSLGTKGVILFKKNIGKSFTLALCSPQLTKFMNPHPH
jgi:hypothetical protein